MRRAAALTDAARWRPTRRLRPGVRDAEIAAVIMDTSTAAAATRSAGVRSSRPGYRAGSAHASFNGRTIQAGETVFLELTAEIRKYTAPLMRTAILGPTVGAQERVAEAGARAVETILATARPGVAAADVARAAGAVLAPDPRRAWCSTTTSATRSGSAIRERGSRRSGFFLRVDNPAAACGPGWSSICRCPCASSASGASTRATRCSSPTPGAEALTKTPARLQVLDAAAA